MATCLAWNSCCKARMELTEIQLSASSVLKLRVCTNMLARYSQPWDTSPFRHSVIWLWYNQEEIIVLSSLTNFSLEKSWNYNYIGISFDWAFVSRVQRTTQRVSSPNSVWWVGNPSLSGIWPDPQSPSPGMLIYTGERTFPMGLERSPFPGI